MATGRDHDRTSLILSAPMGLLIALLLDPTCGLITTAAFAFGGLWLSPDLDTRSNALRRWGILRFIWWPYRRVLPHRSFWSHGPLLGTTGRLLLLIAWLSLVSAFFPWTETFVVINMLKNVWNAQPQRMAAFLIGLEASVWLHLILDGDPLPKEWNRRRKR